MRVQDSMISKVVFKDPGVRNTSACIFWCMRVCMCVCGERGGHRILLMFLLLGFVFGLVFLFARAFQMMARVQVIWACCIVRVVS